ncbi:hypothetical protein CANARDRAFT_196722 [[Candida] arabinofermentans NRRL YB-2248]|uniref:DNA-directed RNA polymerase subunit n=1 Tax=[Candida] arabinofermentans NRRL YB-2248 TaxID=983967 RepID=A0A1E4T300_9ASCO|nr:hypothetical protein CANARDRAFT_196722 [[Candida] arabinofermentans NRRL YB-2248]
MFQLSIISDLLRIPPHLFHLPTEEAIKSELNIKYANKVIHKLGLVISIWDLLEIDDGLLKPGDGATYVNVRFRVVIFKPFVGEVLTGWIEKCTEDGIKVNMEFFNDIFIPKVYLFENSKYSSEDNAWIWEMDEETKLYLDVNEKISFRIEGEVFTDVKPKGPDNTTNELIAGGANTNGVNGNGVNGNSDITNGTNDKSKEQTPPFALIASCQTDGMGCCSWWE